MGKNLVTGKNLEINMFTSEAPDEKTLASWKPMNCPGCVQVFNQGLKSQRDLTS